MGGCGWVGGYTSISNAEQGDPALKPPESENEVELHHSDANLSHNHIYSFILFYFLHFLAVQ